MGISALTIDLGNIFRIRNELHNAADAAALAGAWRLDGTEDGINAARAAAKAMAEEQLANGAQVQLTEANITFGHWDQETARKSQGEEAFAIESDPTLVNAIRVEAALTEDQNSAVSHFFAGIWGNTQSDQGKVAIALGGGAGAACAFPLVLGDCTIQQDPNDNGMCTGCLAMINANNDSIGWATNLGELNSNKGIKEAIKDSCCVPGASDENSCIANLDPEDQSCIGSCDDSYNSSIDKPIDPTEGSDMNGSPSNFCALIEDILLRGNPTEETELLTPTDESSPQILVRRGSSFKATVPVLKGTENGDSCDVEFHSLRRPAGYTTVEVQGISCANSAIPVVDTSKAFRCTDQLPPNGKFVLAEVVCDAERSGSSGGAMFGVSARNMRLVY